MKSASVSFGLLLFATTGTQSAEPAQTLWLEAAKKVHARFTGTNGTFAQFGDSISITMAFWSPLAGEPKNLSSEAKQAHRVVKNYMKPECWNKWKGPAFGNNGS